MKTNLKKWILVVLMVACTSLANATSYFFFHASSTNPNDLNNWWTVSGGTGSHPADFDSGDEFVIETGKSLVTTATWTLTGGATLRIQNAGSLQANHNVDLNGDGTLILEDGGTYLHNHAGSFGSGIFNALSITLTPDAGNGGSTVNIMESCQITNSAIFANLTISGSSKTVTVATPAGIVTVDGTLTINATNTFNVGGSRLLDGTTFLVAGTGTFRSSRSATIVPAGVTWSTTVIYEAPATITVPAGDYTNLNLTPTSGTRTRNYPNGNIRIAGTFTASNVTHGIAATGSLIQFNGTGSQTIPASMSFYDLRISNTGATVLAGGNISAIAHQLTVDENAVLNMGSNTITGSSLTTAGSGTIRTQSTSSTPLPTGRTWSQNVEYNNATGGQTVVNGSYTSLTISNTSGTNTANGAITATNLTLGSGSTFDMATNTLSGLGGSVSGSGTLQTANTSSTPIPGSKIWLGTVVYNSSSSQTIILGSYNNLTASGGARTLDPSGNINISGTFTPGSGTYTNTTSTVVFNGSGAQSIPAITPAYNNLTVSNTGTKSLSGNVTTVGTLTLSTSSDLLSINGNTLDIQGSTSFTGALIGSSTSNLTVSGTGGGSPSIAFSTSGSNMFLNTLTLNRTGAGAGLILETNISITNLLSITNGTLDITGRTVTLKSTSLTNTAQVGPVGGSITYGGSGNFLVERFFPSGNRAYRDIAPGVNTASTSFIFDNWQEGGSAPSGFGTHITGLAGVSPGGVDATTGLDITGSGAVSLYTYTNGVFSSVTNTKTTKPDVYRGYRILMRGDRNVNLYQSPTPSGMNGATVLRTTGELVTGSVTFTTAGVTNAGLNSTYTLNTNNTLNDFSLIGNPYVALLDWEKIVAGARNINLTSTFTVFNGSINTAGAYGTYDAATGISLPNATKVNQYIQPGQSFFVQTTAASPQLQILESDKEVTGTFSQAFRTTSTVNKLLINLHKKMPSNLMEDVDGCAVAFIPTDNNTIDSKDINKFTNGSENLAIYKEGKRIAIERRSSSATTDTIPLRLWQMTNAGTYSLCVDTRDFTSANRAYIIDKYLNTEKITKLSDTTKIDFTVSTADTTSFINRFFIVFRSVAVPLNSINFKASVKGSGVQIDWNTTNETQLANYEVEKSTNGTSFSKIGSVVANNGFANNYSLFDAVPQKGNNYYRIKIVNKDNSSSYSKTILLNLGEVKNNVVIYPNPLKGNNLSLQLNNMEKGSYSLQIFSSGGQTVFSQSFVHDGGTATQTVDLKGNRLSIGQYFVTVTLPNGNKVNKPIFIEE